MKEESSYKPTKFAVIGAGPVGGLVAAFLARGGYEVTLCDVVPALLEPALNPGIVVEGAENLQGKVARVTTRIEDLSTDPPDVIVVTVKTTALPVVASTLEGLGGSPYVISWQNGIDTELELAQRLGAKNVMRGIVNYGCMPAGPGRIRVAFHHRPNCLQELDPQSKEAAVGICQVFTACGLDTIHTDRIGDMVWRKTVLNSCMMAICAVTGNTIAETVSDPNLFELVDAMIREGIAVARASELILGTGFYSYSLNYIKNASNMKPSMLQDIEAGRRTEIDYINGKIIEYGAQVGVPTPYNRMIRGLVKSIEAKAVKTS